MCIRDSYIGGYQVRDAYGVNSILRTGGGNPYDLSLERLDPLIAGLNRTTGQEEKAAAFEAVRETLIDELPYYTFLYKTYGAVAAEGLEGQIQSRYFDLYNGCENFRVKRYQKAADPQV